MMILVRQIEMARLDVCHNIGMISTAENGVTGDGGMEFRCRRYPTIPREWILLLNAIQR